MNARKLGYALGLAFLLVGVIAAVCGFAPAKSATTTIHPTPFYGITLSGLQFTASNGPLMRQAVVSTDDQIDAIDSYWTSGVNTGTPVVRLQVEQDKLVNIGDGCFLSGYLSDVESVVSYAESKGLTVVLNDQTENAPNCTTNEPMPNATTRTFWADVDHVYGNTSVIFDLFNEPKLSDTTANWNTWQSDFQSTVNPIRNAGYTNRVWIDGLASAATLDGVEANLITDPSGTSGTQMYSFHHPAGGHNTTAWFNDFGYLAKDGYWVVNGEENNATDGTQNCWSDARTSIPALLTYMNGNAGQARPALGMTAWTIGESPLPTGPDSQSLGDALTTPTTINSDWNCNLSNAHEGMGNQAHNFFSGH